MSNKKHAAVSPPRHPPAPPKGEAEPDSYILLRLALFSFEDKRTS